VGLTTNALPKDDEPDATVSGRRPPDASHRAGARMGLRCLSVRVSDRIVRHLIGTGYLSLESREAAACVAFALEAWIDDNVP